MQKQWKNFYTAKEKVEWKSTTLMYYTIFHETKIYSHFPPKRGTQNLTSYCIQSEYQYFRGNVNYSFFFFSDCNMPWYFKTIEFSPQMSPIENSKRNEVKTNKQKSRGWGGIKHFFSPISLGFFFFFFNLLKRNPLICQRRWGRCRRWRRRCLPSPRAPVICTLLWTSLRKLPEPCVAQMCDLIESQLARRRLARWRSCWELCRIVPAALPWRKKTPPLVRHVSQRWPHGTAQEWTQWSNPWTQFLRIRKSGFRGHRALLTRLKNSLIK